MWKEHIKGLLQLVLKKSASIEYALFRGYLKQVLSDSLDKISLPCHYFWHLFPIGHWYMAENYLKLNYWFIFLQKECSFPPHHQNPHELNQCDISEENQIICFCSRPKFRFKDSFWRETTWRYIWCCNSPLCPCYDAPNNSLSFIDWEQVAWHGTLSDSHWKVLWWGKGTGKT